MFELAGQLYISLECHNCLSRQFQRRSHILKIIFKLLDVDEPRVLLRMARLILAVSKHFVNWENKYLYL